MASDDEGEGKDWCSAPIRPAVGHNESEELFTSKELRAILRHELTELLLTLRHAIREELSLTNPRQFVHQMTSDTLGTLDRTDYASRGSVTSSVIMGAVLEAPLASERSVSSSPTADNHVFQENVKTLKQTGEALKAQSKNRAEEQTVVRQLRLNRANLQTKERLFRRDKQRSKEVAHSLGGHEKDIGMEMIAVLSTKTAKAEEEKQSRKRVTKTRHARKRTCDMQLSETNNQQLIRGFTKELEPGYKHPLRTCRRFIMSAEFDYISGVLVLLNAISIGAQVHYMALNETAVVPSEFRVIDLIFCVVFALEVLARLVVYRFSFFRGQGYIWNLFDLTIVGMQVIEETLTSIVSSSSTSTMPSFGFMRVLRILRLVRIVRVMRVLRLIGELRTIVISIVNSMKSLGWTVALLFLLIYVIAVYLTQLVLDHRLENSVSDPSLETYFNNLLRSVLSLYEAITGGCDWDDLVRPLEAVNPMAGAIFAIYIAFTLLALMNVVTGVFVESALKSAKEDSDTNMLNHAKAIFRDVSGKSGIIHWAQFENKLDTIHMQEFFKSINVDISEAKNIFQLIDVDESGEIDLDELLCGCLRLRGPAKAIDLSVLARDLGLLAKRQATHNTMVESCLSSIAELLPALASSSSGQRQFGSLSNASG